MIHETAIIDSKAELGADVEIGPYCVIGAGVVLGDGCKLHHHASISGPSIIAANNEFFPFACIGERTQDLKYAGEPTSLEIGSDNVFREFTTVHRSDSTECTTRVGSHGNFLAYSHIAHDCQVGDHCIFSNNGTLAGHVIVEDYAIVGGLSAIHQFCRIGAHSIIGGCAKIVQDVPPFMIADGNPAKIRGVNKVGLQRRGFDENEQKALRETFRLLYRSEFNLAQAVDQAAASYPDSPCVQQLVSFVRASQRGVIR